MESWQPVSANGLEIALIKCHFLAYSPFLYRISIEKVYHIQMCGWYFRRIDNHLTSSREGEGSF